MSKQLTLGQRVRIMTMVSVVVRLFPLRGEKRFLQGQGRQTAQP